MAILLIRHGETDGNASRIVQVPETPLNARGLAQAARLGARLAGRPISRIVASDYARATMTAQVVGDATGVPVTLRPGLRERNFGDHRGRRFDDFDFDIFAPDHVPPNGESVPAFHGRVETEWQAVGALAGDVDGDLVVVSHAMWNRSVVETLFGIGSRHDGSPIRWPNTALSIFEGPPWQATLVANADHLDDDGVADGNHPAGI